MNTLITPVILAGGIGTRLWPLSRQAMPKQFLSLLAEQSLLQSTLQRVTGETFQQPIVVCNEAHRFIAQSQAAEVSELTALLLEPAGKNTAPAVALAAHYALQHGITGPLLVMPADHHIANFAPLIDKLSVACELAQQGQLVTFAIDPTEPHTGYGYIKKGPACAPTGCYHVAEFKEKPTLALANHYLQSGEYGWNSGMFLFTAEAYLAELNRFAPKIAECVAKASVFTDDLAFTRPLADALKACPSDSIDYAILERSNNVAVIPVELEWSDVGSFSALSKLAEKDQFANYLASEGVTIDGRNNLLISEAEHSIAALGVSDMAIIHTHDATLVANKSVLDKLPLLLAQLEKTHPDKLLHHQVVFRPWGSYRILVAGSGFKVKKIIVKPGARLSTQRHQHRAEHWVVVSGIADVSIGNKLQTLSADQSCYIAAGHIHSLANTHSEPLMLIEVQTGAILDENDIERFEDAYGRQ
ncbi:mannose-1-phosphate guanylyltransferase/mannose-6-phosphate isomerase [Pseudoalteromonas mariniglutinosa]|uniref:mannose-1-phosphate guanylyltransferase/mannose-6-phosphate isomerase n=1 Tax=Pseudoalteromonas mariniglutinosa TaxID=206042 RepID=UPI00384ED13D